MLAKLMKYEIKGTARLFIPLYLVLLLFALINRIINPFRLFESSQNFSFQMLLGIISLTVYLLLIVGVFVMVLVIMIQRFYKNLLGDEGYLMFTLPVKPWQHIVSKLLISMLWSILSFITAVCSVLILIDIDNLYEKLNIIIDTFRSVFGNTGFITIPYYALLGLISGILMIYAAIALGHLFQKHRLIASFGMYCILYVVNQTIMALYMLILGNRIFSPVVIASAMPSPSEINTMILLFSIPTVILTAAHFILTNYILKKNLNLE